MRGEEIRAFGGLLFFQAIMWVPSCLGHYWEEGKRYKRLQAPSWFRKIFGDFRKEGSLEVQCMIIQGVGYVITLIAFLHALVSELSRQDVITLGFSQLFLTAIVVGLVRDIIPRLFKRNQ